MKSPSHQIALGGVMAALAVVIMSLGGLIPIATYVCPMVCMMLLNVVLRLCGGRIAWAWYGAVAILGLLLGPDKEAAAVFAALGYYPILKPKMEKLPLPWLWKAILFNAVIIVLYTLLIHLFGVQQVVEDFAGVGTAMLIAMLAMGNVTFFLLDSLLGRMTRRKRRHGK